MPLISSGLAAGAEAAEAGNTALGPTRLEDAEAGACSSVFWQPVTANRLMVNSGRIKAERYRGMGKRAMGHEKGG